MEPEEWLWRLDSIEQAMERTIPNSNLYVLFTLKIDSTASSGQEMKTFPCGRALMSAMYPVPKYLDQETGALYFDLGQLGGRNLPFVVCWDWEQECWSVHRTMPREFFPENPSEPFACETLGWCRWYYLKDTENVKASEAEAMDSRAVELEEAAVEACALAPQVVLDKVGDLASLGDWPTALFYIALKRLHPLMRAWGTHTPNHPWKHDPNADGTFSELNDRMVFLDPDLRTATSHAFDLFRQIIRGTREVLNGVAVGAVSASVSWSKPQGLKEWSKVFGVSENTMRNWLRDQNIQNQQLSPRRWKVAIGDLPHGFEKNPEFVDPTGDRT